MITVVGTGEKKDEITVLGKKTISNAKFVVVRTKKQVFGLKFDLSLDELYEQCDTYDEFNRLAAERLLALEKQYGSVVYAVAGDGFCDSSVEYLQMLGAEITIVAGATAARPASTSAVILSAYDLLLKPQLDNLPLIIHSIDNVLTAGEVKLYLLKFYGFDTPVQFINGQKSEQIILEDLDRVPKYGAFCKAFIRPVQPAPTVQAAPAAQTAPTALSQSNAQVAPTVSSTLFAPAAQPASNVQTAGDFQFDKQTYTYGDLIRIMERLTARDGCPWDKAQTHKSIRSNMIEEAEEAAAAIDSGDTDNLIEELGDVMLQSVFHADIARRTGEFEIGDVISALCRKLYTRHTHIFGGTEAKDEAEALKSWQAAKLKEKSQSKDRG